MLLPAMNKGKDPGVAAQFGELAACSATLSDEEIGSLGGARLIHGSPQERPDWYSYLGVQETATMVELCAAHQAKKRSLLRQTDLSFVDALIAWKECCKVLCWDEHVRAAYDAGAALLDSLDLDEIVPHIFLGALSAAKDAEVLRFKGVEVILTVTAGLLPMAPGFKQIVVEVQDKEEQDMLPHLQHCIDVIAECIDRGQGVLVHCFAGVSRSATAVLVYLMQKKSCGDNMPWQASLVLVYKFVQSRRGSINPNASFMRQLQAFHEMGCPVDLPVDYLARVKAAADPATLDWDWDKVEAQQTRQDREDAENAAKEQACN